MAAAVATEPPTENKKPSGDCGGGLSRYEWGDDLQEMVRMRALTVIVEIRKKRRPEDDVKPRMPATEPASARAMDRMLEKCKC